MRSPALEALLAGLVDYAGLFPPAALDMRAAVAEYAQYRKGTDQWMLGRFVLPAARLAEFEENSAGLLGGGEPWQLSVIATAAESVTISAFNHRHAGRAIVDAIEAKAATTADVAALAAFAGSLEIYVEIPVAGDAGDIAALVRAIKTHGFSAKLRTGGVTADAFPTAAQLTGALAECVRQNVSLKATAGLHHPLRGAYKLTYAPGSASGTMFGFLSVFLATMFLRQGMSTTDAAALLDERDAASITVSGETISWRGRSLAASDIRRLRQETAHSFGSCSFTEPVSDLTSLGIL